MIKGQHHFCRSAGCFCLCLLLLALLGMPAGAVAQDLIDPGTQRPVVAVHYAPNARTMVIGYLETGTTLHVLADAGNFYEIDCYDMTGYIAKELVKQEENRYYVNYENGKWDTSLFYSCPLAETLAKKSEVYALAMPLQGIPYVWAGSSTRGFDCSGLTQYILRHVGIYLGDGKLLHAGTHGVAVVSLDSQYYMEHYLCARRYLLTDRLFPNMPVAIGAVSAIDTGGKTIAGRLLYTHLRD